ncbi:MAG: putative beta-lysine N-acetyltransferase [Planctomycetota bacterium]
MTRTIIDQIETLDCGSVIHHGQLNDRIYLMKASPRAPDLPLKLISMAQRLNYGKVFAKLPARQADAFIAAGYVEEATVPEFYGGEDICRFLAYYLDPQRSVASDADELDAVLAVAKEKASDPSAENDARQTARRLTEDDVEALAAMYCAVFKTYPFPIHNPSYLLETMRSHIVYYGIEDGGSLIAVSSAEMDTDAQAAEMTDFATLPDQRGKGHAVRLLKLMEADMTARGILTAYTIARACSYGMNITFAKCGYQFAGRLINNTNISGRIESMNVWHKRMPEFSDEAISSKHNN